MKGKRILLIVLGVVYLVFTVIHFSHIKFVPAIYIYLTPIRIGVAILAYQYAAAQWRNAAGWAVGCFLFPGIAPLVLAFMEDKTRYSKPVIQPLVRQPVSRPAVETLKPQTAILIPKITQEYLSVSLIESSTLGNAGAGGAAFQQAIQSSNNQNYAGAINSFKEALNAGLDPLRQGYAHANIGTILLLQKRDLAGAVDEFLTVLKLKQALYESVHDAAQYMAVILQTAGRTDEAAELMRLVSKTTARLGYSLAPDVAEKVRALARAARFESSTPAAPNAVKNDPGANARLLEAAKNGNLADAQAAIGDGASINTCDQNDVSALVYAAFHGHKDVAALLIDKGVDVNKGSSTGVTPLANAARSGHSQVVELLLSKGAKINARDRKGGTALLDAIWSRQTEAVRVLIAAGADVNIAEYEGDTALKFAAEQDCREIVELLLQNGADVNAKASNGNTALMYASGEIAALLVAHGADINIKNAFGNSPLSFAEKNGHKELVTILKGGTVQKSEPAAGIPPSTPAKAPMLTYRSKKRNLSFDYPAGWEVIWENEPDCGWEIIVGIAGPKTQTGRACVSLRLLPDAVINLLPEHITVYAAGGPGVPSELVRTPEAYNEECKRELRKVLPGVNFISAQTGTQAGMPTGTLLYDYPGKNGRNREKQINLFGKDVTYRLMGEAPEEQSAFVEAYFDSLVVSLFPADDPHSFFKLR
jgi:ankyrin repeat protein